MNVSFLKDCNNVIKSNRDFIKSINKVIKSCYSINDKNKIDGLLNDCEVLILRNVNNLNCFNKQLKKLPKKQLKDISKKFTFLYIGYRQLEENILTLRDINSL